MGDPRTIGGTNAAWASVPPDVFRAALGRFATGVTVVTTIVEGVPHGMTANAFSSASLEPPLVLVCVDRGAILHDLLATASSFGVSILSADQQALSVWFATPERPQGADQFDGIAWSPGSATGMPLLQQAVAVLECQRQGCFPAGDHSIYIGRVVAASFDTAMTPLLYLDGAYSRPG